MAQQETGWPGQESGKPLPGDFYGQILTRALACLTWEPVGLLAVPPLRLVRQVVRTAHPLLAHHPGLLVGSGLQPPWKAGEGFALLGRTASKPSRFPGPGSRASRVSKPSKFPSPGSRAQPRVRFRETGASLCLTPTDRIHKEDNMVVERRDTEEVGEMILALKASE